MSARVGHGHLRQDDWSRAGVEESNWLRINSWYTKRQLEVGKIHYHSVCDWTFANLHLSHNENLSTDDHFSLNQIKIKCYFTNSSTNWIYKAEKNLFIRLIKCSDLSTALLVWCNIILVTMPMPLNAKDHKTYDMVIWQDEGWMLNLSFIQWFILRLSWNMKILASKYT